MRALYRTVWVVSLLAILGMVVRDPASQQAMTDRVEWLRARLRLSR